METMKDVLCFLNELDFTDKLYNDCFEKLDEIKRMVVRKFEYYNISKLIYALYIVVELRLSAMTNDSDYRLERTDSSRSVILYLISFKHFVDTNKEHENDTDIKHVIKH